jgi:hypothetical protein
MSTPVDDAALVHIAVRKENGQYVIVNGKYVLGVFPARRGETVAFRTFGTNQRKRERPREVAWEGHDIPAGMKLRIVVKPGMSPADKALFPQQVYEILANDTPVRSGPVHLKPGNAGGTWEYNIFLVDQSANADYPNVGEQDPDVDVNPDP